MVVKTPSIGSNHSTSSNNRKKTTSSSASPAAAAAATIPGLASAESEDVDDVKQQQPNNNNNNNNNSGMSNIFQQLLQSMNPAQCLSPTIVLRCSNPLADDDDNDKSRPASYFAKEVPPLLKDLEHEGKLRTTALQKLYRMTDKDNQKNRCVHLTYYARGDSSAISRVLSLSLSLSFCFVDSNVSLYTFITLFTTKF
jgi:hypothetical protein